MIQLRENIAWVSAADGTRKPFDEGRLVASIQRATGEPLLAESITAAVYRYACDKRADQTIPAQEVAELVMSALKMFGLADVAEAYRQRSEWAEIQLNQLASTGSFELGFYRQLDSELHALTGDQPARLHLRGMRACVMQLRGARRWGESCRALANEILSFVRTRIQPVNLEVTE